MSSKADRSPLSSGDESDSNNTNPKKAHIRNLRDVGAGKSVREEEDMNIDITDTESNHSSKNTKQADENDDGVEILVKMKNSSKAISTRTSPRRKNVTIRNKNKTVTIPAKTPKTRNLKRNGPRPTSKHNPRLALAGIAQRRFIIGKGLKESNKITNMVKVTAKAALEVETNGT